MNTANFLTIPATIVPHQEIVAFEGCRQTYQETIMRVQRLAAALATLGIAKGDRVAVLDTNSSRAVEAYFATSLLGAIFVPLNYRATAEELEKQGIKDYQLDYALKTLRRTAPGAIARRNP